MKRFTVSEDVEIILDGKKVLLEEGDELSLPDMDTSEIDIDELNDEDLEDEDYADGTVENIYRDLDDESLLIKAMKGAANSGSLTKLKDIVNNRRQAKEPLTDAEIREMENQIDKGEFDIYKLVNTLPKS